MNAATDPPSSEFSPAYATELLPSTRLRMAVLVSGWLALLTGLVMILHLDIPGLARAALAAAWCVDTTCQLTRQARLSQRVKRLRIAADGRCEARDAADNSLTLRLLGGSVLTRRVAWLRFRFADGRTYGELLSRATAGHPAWRRLQIIWRWGQPLNDK